jgi:hypothetical protein
MEEVVGSIPTGSTTSALLASNIFAVSDICQFAPKPQGV